MPIYPFPYGGVQPGPACAVPCRILFAWSFACIVAIAVAWRFACAFASLFAYRFASPFAWHSVTPVTTLLTPVTLFRNGGFRFRKLVFISHNGGFCFWKLVSILGNGGFASLASASLWSLQRLGAVGFRGCCCHLPGPVNAQRPGCPASACIAACTLRDFMPRRLSGFA